MIKRSSFPLHFIMLFFIYGLLSSCAGPAKSIDPGDYGDILKKVFSNLDEEVSGSGSSDGNFEIAAEKDLEPQWTRYTKSEVFNPKSETYDELVDRLRRACLAKISNEIEISIKAVFSDSTWSDDDEYNSLVTNYILTQTSGTFTGKDIKRGKITKEKELSPLDTLTYILYFSKDNYYERIDREKAENEKKAIDALKTANDYYSAGNLVNCLSKMAICHYSISQGGREAAYSDYSGNTIRVVDELYTLAKKIGGKLEIEFLDDSNLPIDDKKRNFIKSDPIKEVRFRLVWNHSVHLLDNIDIQLVAKDILGNDYTDSRGIAEIDIKDSLPDSREKIDTYVRINMIPSNATTDKFYIDSDHFHEFVNTILNERLTITNYSFPVHKIAIITGAPGNNDELRKGSLDAINNFGRPFFKVVDIDDSERSVLKNYLRAGKNKIDLEDYKGWIDGILILKYTWGNKNADGSVRNTSRYEIRFYTLKSFIKKTPLITHVYDGSVSGYATLEESQLAVKDFFDNNFHRDISLQLAPMVHPATAVAKHSDNDIYESEPGDKTLLLERQSRYHNLVYDVSAPGYETLTATQPAEKFNFINGPRSTLKTERLYLPMTKKVGHLEIKVFPDREYLHQFDKDKLEISLKKKKWYIITETDTIFTGKKKQYFSTENFGRYTVSARHKGFDTPPAKYPRVHYAETEKISFDLKYKSPIKAQIRSFMVPGIGHWYMGRPWYEIILPMTLSSVFRAGFITSGVSYLDHRSQFETNQDSYGNALNAVESELYKQQAINEWDQMQTAKNQFKITFVSAVITNVATGIWLWFKTR